MQPLQQAPSALQELWVLLNSASTTASGIPESFEAKERERLEQRSAVLAAQQVCPFGRMCCHAGVSLMMRTMRRHDRGASVTRRQGIKIEHPALLEGDCRALPIKKCSGAHLRHDASSRQRAGKVSGSTREAANAR